MKNNTLIIIPHGGTVIPEELEPCTEVNDLTLFLESDCCANQIFNFENSLGILKTEISPLFIDLNKSYQSFAQRQRPGVIRRTTRNGINIFNNNYFPDDLALANIFKRHYFPFFRTLKKIIDTGEIDVVIECHTMWPIGPSDSMDAGEPRPSFLINHVLDSISGDIDCGHDKFMVSLKTELHKSFNSAKAKNEIHDISISHEPLDGFIMREIAYTGIPIISLSVSRSLFLNEKYFNSDYLLVDELRIQEIKDKIWNSISIASEVFKI